MSKKLFTIIIVACAAMLIFGCSKEEPRTEEKDPQVQMSYLRKDGTYSIWTTPEGLEFKCDIIGNDCKLNSGLVVTFSEEEFFETFYGGLDLAGLGLEDFDELPINENVALMEHLEEEEDYYITHVKNGSFRMWATPSGIEVRCDAIGNKCKLNSGFAIVLDETDQGLYYPGLEPEAIELLDPNVNSALLSYLMEQEELYFFED